MSVEKPISGRIVSMRQVTNKPTRMGTPRENRPRLSAVSPPSPTRVCADPAIKTHAAPQRPPSVKRLLFSQYEIQWIFRLTRQTNLNP
ncbi:hypothetical protein PUN4_530069 [Paraburkholderia unamae]|nr:hypothetical protein PUN4_530069 [Paraburkholderia unamae]